MRSDTGDIGRRVARRRAELGMSRGELADRAGVAIEFVEYVETQPAELATSSLDRLAAALDLNPRTLLGAGYDRPPGGRASQARPVARELSPRECRALIRSGGVGRIAASTDDGLVVLPVNFTVDDSGVIVRTTAYGVLGRLDRAAEVAFEVDRIDDAMRQGWSVLMVGEIEPIDDPAEMARLQQTADLTPGSAESATYFCGSALAASPVDGSRLRNWPSTSDAADKVGGPGKGSHRLCGARSRSSTVVGMEPTRHRRQIVVGVNPTPESGVAVRWAVAEAALRDRSLRLLSVDAGRRPVGHGWVSAPLLPRDERTALDQARQYASDRLGDKQVTVELFDGMPVRVLQTAATTADLLVVGSRRQNLRRSVAHAAAAYAMCPVVVVRGQVTASRQRIVVGLDGSVESDHALAFAFDEAERRGAVVEAVRSWRPMGSETSYRDWIARTEADFRQRLEDSVAAYRSKYPDTPVVERVLQGRPWDQLASRSADADLVVVGSRGFGRVVGQLLGSVSQSLIGNAECPVVVVKSAR
ncbi:MAG TPA: universal stress protein [Nocardioidaceae bacterium]|nr:universal stress protein [Nocardioidaceae bacterium]